MQLSPIIPFREAGKTNYCERCIDGIFFNELVILACAGEDGRDLKEMRPRKIAPAVISDRELAKVLLLTMQTWPRDDQIELLRHHVTSRLPFHWKLSRKDLKKVLSLQKRHIEIIRQAEMRGFSLKYFDPSGRSRRFCFKREDGLWFELCIGHGDDFYGLPCVDFGPASAADEDDPFGLNPYPITVHEGQGTKILIDRLKAGLVVQQFEGDLLISASKPYKHLTHAHKLADTLRPAFEDERTRVFSFLSKNLKVRKSRRRAAAMAIASTESHVYIKPGEYRFSLAEEPLSQFVLKHDWERHGHPEGFLGKWPILGVYSSHEYQLAKRS